MIMARAPSEGSTDRWENEGGPTCSPARYGIVPVQLTVFDWGGYRYSNAWDAIAAAKRMAKATQGAAERR